MTRSKDRVFSGQVDGWILELTRDYVTDFSALVQLLPGVYPLAVIESLRRLRESGSIDLATVDRLMSAAKNGVPQRIPDSCEILPAPHPLDFDWRFTTSTSIRLLDNCQYLAGRLDSLTILGAPTVFLEAVQRVPLDRLQLLDVNPLVIHALQNEFAAAKVFECDLVSGAPVSTNNLAAVIADPPWYQEHMHCFLWAATRLCRVGGHVLFSLPPRGTRPGVMCERSGLLKWAEDIGMSVLRIDDAALRYMTPPYERNALRAAGIESVPSDWRTGDLAVLCRTDDIQIPRPIYRSTVCKWAEACFERVRLKLRHRNSVHNGDPTLHSIVAGDVLDSVSRRDPRIGEVDVWTAGNRVFGCEDTWTLRVIIEALKTHVDPVDKVTATARKILPHDKANQVRAAAGQIAELVKVEAADC